MLQINKEIYLQFGAGRGGEEEALNYRFDDFLVSCFWRIAISQDCFIQSHKSRRERLLILRPLSFISLNCAFRLQITFIHDWFHLLRNISPICFNAVFAIQKNL